MFEKNADSIIARLHLKNQLNVWRAVAILACVGLGIFISESKLGSFNNVALDKDFIGRVTIDSFVSDDRDLLDTLDEFNQNKRGKALIVWLDTPGGSAVGGEEVYFKLREIAKARPVVAVMRSIATSAGYMIALGSDHIIAREGTITGSIGVLIESAEVTELAKKLGVTPISIKSTPLKGSPGLLEKASPEAVASLQSLIDDFYKTFVKMVAERRNLKLEDAYKLADGRVYSGNQALDAKLIDAIGGEQEALVWLQVNKKIDKNLDISDIDQKPHELDFIQELTQTVSRNFFGKSASSLDGLISLWHPTH
jgi:protease-4